MAFGISVENGHTAPVQISAPEGLRMTYRIVNGNQPIVEVAEQPETGKTLVTFLNNEQVIPTVDLQNSLGQTNTQEVIELSKPGDKTVLALPYLAEGEKPALTAVVITHEQGA